ncbi:MAG: invasion associated locus B family protein [Hyphomicrobiales bacterium]
MMRISVNKILQMLGLSLFICAFVVSQTQAAQPNKKFGNWLLHCSEIAAPETIPSNGANAPTKDACALFQSVAAENRPRFGLTVLISKDDGTTTISTNSSEKPAGLIKILVPLGVLIPTGVGMNIDGENLGLTGFLRCLPNGCTAVATLSQPLLTTLKQAKTASFTVFLTPEDGLSIPIKLDGLAEGFDALK